MPRIERLFSSQPATGAPGVFDRGGPGFAEGAADATRQIRGASRRAFASQQAALDRQTSALVDRGNAERVLGAAVAGAGRDLVDIGVQVKRREENAERESAFATARSNLMRADDEAQREAREGGAPDGSDYELLYLKRFETARSEILGSLRGDAGLERAVTLTAREIGGRGQMAVRTAAAKAGTATRIAQLEARIADIGNRAVASRGLEQQLMLAAAFQDIDAQFAARTIDRTQRNAKQTALRGYVRDGAIAREASRDPAAAGAVLAAGGYDHLFVNPAEKAAAEQVIDTELSVQRAAAQARLDDDIDTHIERIRTSGRGVPGMKARVRVLDGDVARFADLEAQAEVYFRTAQRIRWATPAAAEAALAEQKAAVQVDDDARTPDGFPRRELIQSGADKAAADRRERLADDPYAHAAEHPVLGQTRENVIALQKAMGVEAYAFMSADEAAGRVRTFATTPDEGKAELLRQWSGEAGKHRPALLRDLAAAQLPATALLLLRHAENPRQRAVLDRGLAAAGQGYRALTRDFGPDEDAALRQAVAARLEGTGVLLDTDELVDDRPGFANDIAADGGDRDLLVTTGGVTDPDPVQSADSQVAMSKLPRILKSLDQLARHNLRIQRLKNRVQTLFQQQEAFQVDVEVGDLGPETTRADALAAFAQAAEDEQLEPPGGQHHVRLLLGPIADNEVTRISQQADLDAKGFERIVESDALIHALKRHGADGETEPKNDPITVEDFRRLPDVWANPDDISIRRRKSPKTSSLIYKKRINGTIIYVEEVRVGNKHLTFKTMWKEKL